MDQAGVLPGSRAARAMERMKTTAGVVAAVAGAITGMWTIYEKVKSDARQYTAASYETLAPQLNQMNEALQKLEQENQQLKKAILASHAERPRAVARPSRAAAPPRAAGPAPVPAPASGNPAAPGPTAAETPETT